LSASQTGLESGKYQKIELDSASIDTDNAFSDGKFQPKVAGHYQVNTCVHQACNPTATQIVGSLYKNGEVYSYGTNYHTSATASVSTGSDVVYLNGTTDYLELYGYLKSTGDCGVRGGIEMSHLSAVLVSGGSSSGDSIWTDVDGKAVYDGEVNISLDEPDGSGATDALVIQNSADQSGDGSTIKFLCGKSTEAGAQITAVGRTLNKADLVFSTGNADLMTLDVNGTVKFGTNMTIGNTGVISAQGINDTTTNALAPNVCVDGLGVLRKSTVVTYSVEEVDKKLAVKDKLIEKLSDRLDKLEKKLKKTK
jgi:hypothetical protein